MAGDRAAGYRTIATEYGTAATIWVFRFSALVFLALAIVASVAWSGNVLGFISLSVLVVAPIVSAIWKVRGTPDAGAIEAGLSTTGLVFAGGTITLLLL